MWCVPGPGNGWPADKSTWCARLRLSHGRGSIERRSVAQCSPRWLNTVSLPGTNYRTSLTFEQLENGAGSGTVHLGPSKLEIIPRLGEWRPETKWEETKMTSSPVILLVLHPNGPT